ncbi:hypothetical protein Tco_1405155 [Tanacetum coccineum]
MLGTQVVWGEGSGQPTEPQHTPTTTLPSHVEAIPAITPSSQPKKTYKHRKTKRKATEISQSNGPTTLVADEIVYEEKGDNMKRAATTATSLDAEHGSGNIISTQSMATLNEPIPQGTSSGSGPRRQDTILGDRPAQTRFERLSKQSNDPPLSRVNTLGSGEDSMKLNELMEICTKLSEKVLALENIKTAQDLEITNLKKRVKKLEKKKKSRTPQLKRRLFKVRIESSAEKSLGDQEDASKQGTNEINQEEGISWFQEDSETQGRYGHDIEINTVSTSITTAIINITTAEPVTTASAPVATTGVSVSTVEPRTPPPPTTIFIEDEDLIIAQTLMKMRTSETTTRPIVPPQQQLNPKDKGKGIMQEPEKPVKVKGKDQIEYDTDLAQRLQAELDDEVNDFDPMDTESSGKKAESSRKKAVSKKRAGEKLVEESVKRQKVEDDDEKAELNACLEIVPGDDIVVNIESLSTKYPIIDWKTHILAEDKMYYQIIRADGSIKYYKIFSAMLDDFDRQDVLDLYRLVKERFETTSPEGYDRLI